MATINQTPPGQASVSLSALRFHTLLPRGPVRRQRFHRADGSSVAISPCGAGRAGAVPLLPADGQIYPLSDRAVNPLRLIPQVNGSTWHGDSVLSTSRTLDVPSHQAGDLLVAVLLWRESAGAISSPPGWSFHGRFLRDVGRNGIESQWLYVYTRTASESEPVSYAWFSVAAASNAGLMVSVDRGSIVAITESYGNSDFAAARAVDGCLNLCVFTWIYSFTTSIQVQRVTGLGVVPILRSPAGNARLSAGYTRQAGQVTAFHSGITTATPPNHGAINIQIA